MPGHPRPTAPERQKHVSHQTEAIPHGAVSPLQCSAPLLDSSLQITLLVRPLEGPVHGLLLLNIQRRTRNEKSLFL